MIFFKNKLIFIHIPRTAGSTVENFLWKYEDDLKRTSKNLWMGFVTKYNNEFQTGGLQHLTTNHVTKIYPKEMSEYFTFAFVRNPFTRIVSQYLYTLNHRADLQEYLGIDYNAPYEKYLEKIDKIDHVQWMPMHKFLLDESDNLKVKFVGRQENFKNDFLKVLKKINISYNDDFLIQNKSNNNIIYKDFYKNRANIEFIEKKYKKDLEFFNYTFKDIN